MYRFAFTSIVVVGLIIVSSPVLGFKDKDKDEKKDEKKEVIPPPKKETPSIPVQPLPDAPPGEAEIVFLNGSKVRVTLFAEKLEIATLYGKLTVPIHDVESIEFGLHFPEGVPDRIEQAIKSLNNSDYREREKAFKTLVDLGPYAYPSVLKATRAKELEVSKRAKEIVQKMQAKYSKKELKTSVEDRVVTPTHTIVGRILTSSVRTKAEYFGEIDHKFANMRTLRTIGAPGQEIEVSVDAAKYAAQGGNEWMETGFQWDGRSTIVITAKGMVDTWPQQPGGYMSGPAGSPGGMRKFPGAGGGLQQGGQKILGPLNGQQHGAMLIGKIGESGEPFLIADRFEGKLDTDGKLYLIIGPSPWSCPSTGSYEVKVSRKND